MVEHVTFNHVAVGSNPTGLILVLVGLWSQQKVRGETAMVGFDILVRITQLPQDTNTQKYSP